MSPPVRAGAERSIQDKHRDRRRSLRFKPVVCATNRLSLGDRRAPRCAQLHGYDSLSDRLHALKDWLTGQARLRRFEIEPASEDASFRRYFRVRSDDGSLIVMDAPPEREDPERFVDLARALARIGLHVPEIVHTDVAKGFVLMSDLGSTLYLDVLGEDTVERLYGDALGALVVLQACGPRDYSPPPYDRGLLWAEMELFRRWYLERHLAVALDASQRRLLDEAFALLADAALQQPRVWVHRDYHSRNLMVTAAHNPGVLDFQDAVIGPVTYDLVSLLRDCYIAWPRERVEGWALGYHDLALQTGILRERDEEQFLRWFDLMGVQRHLKASGVFARLNHRDQKPGYLGDIPRTLGYVRDVASRYGELASLGQLLDDVEGSAAERTGEVSRV